MQKEKIIFQLSVLGKLDLGLIVPIILPHALRDLCWYAH